jgi:hypothetical protein
MNLREAAQQALDELIAADGMPICNETDILDLSKTITALRAALAEDAMHRLTDVQQEMEATSQESRQVEPVAYVTGYSKGYAVVQPVDRSLLMPVGMALYRSPPTINEMETVEPVAYVNEDGWFRHAKDADVAFKAIAIPLYVNPPPRKRTPLTEPFLEELAEKHVTNCYFDTLTYARAIERAHGIGGEA